MRSTLTRTVLVILADTTVPSRRLILSRIGYLLVGRGRAARLLAEQSHDERQLAARAPIAGMIVQLIGAQLEAQAEISSRASCSLTRKSGAVICLSSSS